MKSKLSKHEPLTPEVVRQYLAEHPEFIKKNLDLVSGKAVPARDLGEDIVDFQHYLVHNLQKDSKALKGRYDLLVDFCRDNMSAQAQVHQAVLCLMQAKSLEQLLETIAQDLLHVFNVDVVRLAMESDMPMDVSYGEQHYSGIVFVEPGITELMFSPTQNVLLIADTTVASPPGFEQVFADCEAMITSCALLRLELQTVGKNVLLAFGVRHKERFHEGQGVELLRFLSQVVALQMDAYLGEMAI